MRCLLLIVCLGLASADHLSKYRFYNLLNRRSPIDLTDDQWDWDEYGLGECTYDRWGFDKCPRRDYLDERYDIGDYDDLLRGSDSDTGLLKEVEDANIKLTSRLYKQTRDERDDKNIVISPFSIQMALAALNYGARGNTKRQISRVISGGLRTEERREILKYLLRKVKGIHKDYLSLGRLTRINPVTLIAVSKSTPAQRSFIEFVTGRSSGTCHVKHFSFHSRPEECRKLINGWIGRKTNMKFTGIIPRDIITDNTKMILINTLDMRAHWGEHIRFITKEGKFFPLGTDRTKMVEVMKTDGLFKYYEDELLKIVGIPTKDKELTFYFIVPKEKDGLTHVEKLHLHDSEQLKHLLYKTDLRWRRVGIELPKFEIKHKIDVRRTLRAQGVTDALDRQRADFSGITGDIRGDLMDEDKYDELRRLRLKHVYDRDVDYDYEDIDYEKDRKLHLNKFIHGATIKITERGITAAMGDEGGFDERKLRYDRFGDEFDERDKFDNLHDLYDVDSMGGEKLVKANRAFAFAVKHNPTKQILLVGRVIDAGQKKLGDLRETIDIDDRL